MRFAGVNYLAVVIAAVVAWLAGAGWYTTFGKSWMAALGLTPEKMQEAKSQPGAYLPFVYAFIVNLIMAMTALPAFAVMLEKLFPRKKPIKANSMLNH